MKISELDFRSTLTTGTPFSLGICHRIPCSSRFAVVDSDNSCRVVNHPLVPPLETIPAVAWADEPHQIGLFHDPPIPLLPVLAPANLKAPIRAGTDEPNSCSIGSKIQHDFCYQRSTPRAVPYMNVRNLSAIAVRISFFSASTTTASGCSSFSGLCPAKQLLLRCTSHSRHAVCVESPP